MNEELEIMWKEVLITYSKVLSWHLPGGTVENHKRASFRIVIIPFKI
jgi:hypothetical protein